MQLPEAPPSEDFRDLPGAPLMRMIPPGSFIMGTRPEEDGLDDERPAHQVFLDKPFSVGVFPITFKEWDAFATETRGYRPERGGLGRGRYPVVGVTWTDAKSYCAWLSKKTGRRYRLLTEAEWEYCARAEIGAGAAISSLGLAQFPECRTAAAPVGAGAPNAFGLFDMFGSVWQWVEDLFHSDYMEAPENGDPWLENGVAQLRMLRGGSWATEPAYLRPAFRHAACESQRDLETGFRVARDMTGEVETSVPEPTAAHRLGRRVSAAALDLSLDVPAGRASESLRIAVSNLVADPDAAAMLGEFRTFSMLDTESLAMLHCLGGVNQGGVLEIGPYIGGSTVAIATARSGQSAPFVTIEVGGDYPDQPFLPSDDILADLRINLTRFGVENQVFIVQGWSHDRRLQWLVNQIFERGKIGLLVIDSDGQVEATLGDFAPLLRHDCLVVIDDYIAPLALSKQHQVQPAVDRWVEQRVLREFGVFGGGTWAGQVNGEVALNSLITKRKIFLPETGYCFRYFARDLLFPSDTLESMAVSQLILREDGRPLGPAHSLHKAIRLFGRGRYSHWAEGTGTSLYFSTSDNSDPNVNGRDYSLEFAGVRFELTGS